MSKVKLHIKNTAKEVDLSRGQFVIFTGETGTGKSKLISQLTALSLNNKEIERVLIISDEISQREFINRVNNELITLLKKEEVETELNNICNRLIIAGSNILTPKQSFLENIREGKVSHVLVDSVIGLDMSYVLYTLKSLVETDNVFASVNIQTPEGEKYKTKVDSISYSLTKENCDLFLSKGVANI